MVDKKKTDEIKRKWGLNNLSKSHDEIWSYEQMVNCPIYRYNRDVEPRKKRIKKILEKELLPTHTEFKVFKFMCDMEDGSYKKGDMARGDGNTRMAIYEEYPYLIPPIFKVTIYEIWSVEQAKNLYNSIDSQDSVENISDKITGFHRNHNMYFKEKKFHKGLYKTAMDTGGKYMWVNVNGELKAIKNLTPEQKTVFFGVESLYLDSLNFTPKRYCTHILSTYLILIKKYGLHHPRIELLINNFKYGITETCNNEHIDGVHYVYNQLYMDYKEMWSKTGFDSSKELLLKIFYCFDTFVQGIPLTKKNNSIEKVKIPNIETLENYFINASDSASKNANKTYEEIEKEVHDWVYEIDLEKELSY